MSWQTPTHSSQMKTVGPAISFRTSFWLLLQNEHRRTSSLFFFNYFLSCSKAASKPGVELKTKSINGFRRLSSLGNNLVDNTILLRLVRGHDVVPFDVFFDPLQSLRRMLGQNLV